MKEFDEYLSMVNQAIANLKLPAQPAGLYAPIRYTLDCGGKRLRLGARPFSLRGYGRGAYVCDTSGDSD